MPTRVPLIIKPVPDATLIPSKHILNSPQAYQQAESCPGEPKPEDRKFVKKLGSLARVQDFGAGHASISMVLGIMGKCRQVIDLSDCHTVVNHGSPQPSSTYTHMNPRLPSGSSQDVKRL